MVKKRFAQHFLRDKNYIERILKGIKIKPPAGVLEIGPGKGNLTFPLLDKGYKVFAIEKDRDFEKFLKKDNLIVFYEDGLYFPKDLEEFLKEKEIDLVISNLPYNVGTRIYLRYLPYLKNLKQMVLMFQREVGEKIKAKVGERDYGFLSVITNLLAEVEEMLKVPPDAFYPKPDVYSMVLSFKSKRGNPFPYENFLKFLKIPFTSPRKTLYNNLIKFYKEEEIEEMFFLNKIPKNIRPHQIEGEKYLTFFKFLKEKENAFSL